MAIVQAVAAGDISPDQGGEMLTALGSLARIREFDEFERRLAALEVHREKQLGI